jgi:hypothetical protein
MNHNTNKLTTAQKTQVLFLITHQQDIIEFMKEINLINLLGLREFLFLQAKDLAEKLLNKNISRQTLQKKMIPVSKYFHSQDCREPLESCVNDTCYELYPSCFKRKLFGQIGTIYEFIREEIFKNKNASSNIVE